jgi:ELWxxDGT repeat protein
MPSNLLGIGGTVFFLAKASAAATRAEIWKSDGTSGGTVRVSNLEASGACLVEFGGSLFFTGGGSLWKSDGTPEGTVALKDLGQYVGCESAAPHAADGTLFIAMHDRLWKSDGTPRGTVFVKEYPPGFFLQISLPPVHIGATLFFLLTDNSTMQLWKSDGTGPGTVRLKQDAVDPIVDPGTRLFALGHQLLFAGKDAEHGTELWTSDGTEAGTRLLADLEPGRQSSGPEGFIELGGRALFSASAAGRSLPYQPRTSLWTSDGTTAGTTLVRPHVDSRRMARMGKDVYWIRPR